MEYKRHAHFRGGFIHQVNGFIGQVTVGDIAICQTGRGDQRLIRKMDFVMRLIAVTQAHAAF